MIETRWDKKLTLVKEAGHILGLDGSVTVKGIDKSEQVKCEGVSSLDGLGFFLKY